MDLGKQIQKTDLSNINSVILEGSVLAMWRFRGGPTIELVKAYQN